MNNHPQSRKLCAYCKEKLLGHRKCKRCFILLHDKEFGLGYTLNGGDNKQCFSCYEKSLTASLV